MIEKKRSSHHDQTWFWPQIYFMSWRNLCSLCFFSLKKKNEISVVSPCFRNLGLTPPLPSDLLSIHTQHAHCQHVGYTESRGKLVVDATKVLGQRVCFYLHSKTNIIYFQLDEMCIILISMIISVYILWSFPIFQMLSETLY